MLALLKKKPHASAATASASKTASVDARDFVPHFTHYDAHTLVTKNGELIQTLRISENRHGLNYEPHDISGHNLRESIRKALVRHVSSDNIALWVHTLRRKRGVSFQAQYENHFATYLNKGWREKHGWSHQYYNEVYITLVYEGQSGTLFDKHLMKESITTKKSRALRNTYLEAASGELELMTNGVIDELRESYRVHRLSITDRVLEAGSALPSAPVFYSEPMEFLSYLLNLRTEAVPLPDADISAALQSCDLLFGFNAMETKSAEGVKRFGALLSLKQYREVPSHTVDMLLQAPMELIVSQAFHFIPGEGALKEYRHQKEFFDISGDSYSMQATGLLEMLQADKKRPTDFGHQQISIMVVVDELKRIDEDIARLQTAFSSIGLVCVREDIRLEEIFWSMLPGNFVFLRRKSPISTSRIAGFAKLNRFSTGQSEGAFWGQPIALVPTLVNSPYFFNFHVQDNGHTLWVDFNSFNDSVATQSLSFLLTQSDKLKPRVFYFDHHASAALWFEKMDEEYHYLSANAAPRGFSLNPFSLDSTPRNFGFLAAWCSELVEASTEERAQIKDALSSFYQKTSLRSLSGFVAHLHNVNSTLAERFSPWLEAGEYGGLFSGDRDDFTLQNRWVGIDLTAALTTAQNAIAAFAYLLHRIILSLDGTPTIIVLRHAMPILQQPFFASRLTSLLEMLRENNAMMVFCVRYSETLPAHPVTDILLQHCASKIISPDDLRLDYAALFPALISPNDQDMLWHMDRMQGDCMLKQLEDTVAIRINLDSMPDIASIFAGDVKTLMSAGGPYASLPTRVRHG